MKLVIIESPLGTNADGSRCTPEEFEKNQRYAEACMLDSLRKNETAFASHVLYPLVLKDADPKERRLGMEAGFAVAKAFAMARAYVDTHKNPRAEGVDLVSAVYTDRGVSSGMAEGIERNQRQGFKVEYRSLGNQWAK